MIYHVSIQGNDKADGSASHPFRTIGRAAAVAKPGDTVQVHEGVYREWVDPRVGGLNDAVRIVYEAAPGEKAVIKGSEVITGWEKVEGTVWKKVVPNTLFGDWNPYVEKLWGDWFRQPTEYPVHTGDVYLNGKSMYEASSREDLFEAKVREIGCQDDPDAHLADEMILHPEDTVYRWLAEVDEENTTLYGNFQDKDPNRETVEINVRKCCFFPRKTGVDYITVRGFEMAHAATPFNPPTAEQIGMVGPNWAKGWIIENNDLHDAKTSAVSLGKEAATGHNLATLYGRKSSHRYQAEAVFSALRIGWSKEKIGSHIVRNNQIHDCGQNGIVGHLGAVFSRIEHNHIYNISVKHEFFGHELGGIKLHAAIDVVIENNNIHHCVRGMWLDWQAQGTRVSRNLFHHNVMDLMIEVTHGPCLVDNNLFLSKYAWRDDAQGTALVHNFVAGIVKRTSIMKRATPYHYPHTTQVAGYLPVYGGDDRVYNNLFAGITPDQPGGGKVPFVNFSHFYNEFLTPEEHQKRVSKNICDRAFYATTPQAVWIEDNAYAGFAAPYQAEKGAVTVDKMLFDLTEKDGAWFFEITVPEEVVSDVRPVNTARLGAPRVTEELYESPDGSPIEFTLDLPGKVRGKKIVRGPFADLAAGKQVFCVWKE